MGVVIGIQSHFPKPSQWLTQAKIRTALALSLEAAGQTVKTLAQLKMMQNFDIQNQGGGSFFDSLEVVVNPAALTATIGDNHPGARLQEMGGDVFPVNAKMLHWVQDGQDVFAMHAHIPARPYLGPATDEAAPLIEAGIIRTLALAAGF